MLLCRCCVGTDALHSGRCRGGLCRCCAGVVWMPAAVATRFTRVEVEVRLCQHRVDARRRTDAPAFSIVMRPPTLPSTEPPRHQPVPALEDVEPSDDDGAPVSIPGRQPLPPPESLALLAVADAVVYLPTVTVSVAVEMTDTLMGRQVELDRPPHIPVAAYAYVDPAFGSGAVKPATGRTSPPGQEHRGGGEPGLGGRGLTPLPCPTRPGEGSAPASLPADLVTVRLGTAGAIVVAVGHAGLEGDLAAAHKETGGGMAAGGPVVRVPDNRTGVARTALARSSSEVSCLQAALQTVSR